jgi:hypothetical protein
MQKLWLKLLPSLPLGLCHAISCPLASVLNDRVSSPIPHPWSLRAHLILRDGWARFALLAILLLSVADLLSNKSGLANLLIPPPLRICLILSAQPFGWVCQSKVDDTLQKIPVHKYLTLTWSKQRHMVRKDKGWLPNTADDGCKTMVVPMGLR